MCTNPPVQASEIDLGTASSVTNNKQQKTNNKKQKTKKTNNKQHKEQTTNNINNKHKNNHKHKHKYKQIVMITCAPTHLFKPLRGILAQLRV